MPNSSPTNNAHLHVHVIILSSFFHLLEIPILDTKLLIAFNEFFYVAGLVLIIAIVSLLTGIMREYIPQENSKLR